MADYITLINFFQELEMSPVEICLTIYIGILLWRIPDIIRALKGN